MNDEHANAAAFERVATITVPEAPVSETTAIFRRLRALHAELVFKKVNDNEAAAVMIAACITEGIDTRLRIRRALEKIGLNGPHVVIILNRQTGADPARYSWRRDEAECYHLFDAA